MAPPLDERTTSRLVRRIGSPKRCNIADTLELKGLKRLSLGCRERQLCHDMTRHDVRTIPLPHDLVTRKLRRARVRDRYIVGDRNMRARGKPRLLTERVGELSRCAQPRCIAKSTMSHHADTTTSQHASREHVSRHTRTGLSACPDDQHIPRFDRFDHHTLGLAWRILLQFRRRSSHAGREPQCLNSSDAALVRPQRPDLIEILVTETTPSELRPDGRCADLLQELDNICSAFYLSAIRPHQPAPLHLGATVLYLAARPRQKTRRPRRATIKMHQIHHNATLTQTVVRSTMRRSANDVSQACRAV